MFKPCNNNNNNNNNNRITVICTDGPAPATCAYYEFACTDGSCIDDRLKCDGRPHCNDGSDELDCGMNNCFYFQFLEGVANSV